MGAPTALLSLPSWLGPHGQVMSRGAVTHTHTCRSCTHTHTCRCTHTGIARRCTHPGTSAEASIVTRIVTVASTKYKIGASRKGVRESAWSQQSARTDLPASLGRTPGEAVVPRKLLDSTVSIWPFQALRYYCPDGTVYICRYITHAIYGTEKILSRNFCR